MMSWTLTSDWVDFPDGTRANGQVFAIGDVHGRADLLEGLLAHIEALPAPEAAMPRHLVFLGDLIDRGPENLRAIRLAMDATLDGRPAVILPGNHEGMLFDALQGPISSGAFHMWYENGGHALVDELSVRPAETMPMLRARVRDALPEGFLDLLKAAPTHFRSGDLLFVHAGILPPPFLAKNDRPHPVGSLEDFLAQPIGEALHMHWAWVREPFIGWTEGWDPGRRQVVVHGHTIECRAPIEDTGALTRGVDFVAERRRINLDLGAVFFGRLAALEAVDRCYRFHCIIDDRALGS